MARIAFRKMGGLAGNIRFVSDSYVLGPDELEVKGDTLPELDSLSDPAALGALEKERSLAEARAAAMRALHESQLNQALADPDAPQDVKDYAAALAATNVL